MGLFTNRRLLSWVLLCMGLSPARRCGCRRMNAGQTEGSDSDGKGEQDKMKGDDMRAPEADRKGGQAGMKGAEEKTKRVDTAGKPSEKKKEIKQNEMGEIKK